MALSLLYVLPALAVLLIVFLLVNRLRGPALALAAAVLAFVGLLALYAVTLVVITSGMQ